MSDYRAPTKDMRFVMDEIAGFQQLSQIPAYADATPDMADAILDEAAKFTREVNIQGIVFSIPSSQVNLGLFRRYR